MSSWVRRNRWALAGLPLVASAAFLVAGRDLLDVWFDDPDARPERAVRVGDPFEWGGGTFELVAFERVTDPVGRDGEQYEPPAGTVLWRGDWQASVPDEEDAYACQVLLVDAADRRYAPGPFETHALDGAALCTPGFDDDPSGYRFTQYFLLPADADPAWISFGGGEEEQLAITLP